MSEPVLNLNETDSPMDTTYVPPEQRIGTIDSIDDDTPAPTVAPMPTIQTNSSSVSATTAQPARKGPTSLAQIIVGVTSKMKEKEIAPLAADMFITQIPSDITPLDLDVMKLSAQFVARNGHQFQVGLMNREHKNPQFEFLKPNHFLHPFFLRLVESYTRCLLPPKNCPEKLQQEFGDKREILERIIVRYEQEKQLRAQKAAEEQKESEQLSNSQINWGEFVVVETIDFEEEEEAPQQPAVVPAPEVRQKTPVEGEDMETEDMDVEDETPKPSSMEVLIRKDYVRPNPALLKKGPIQYQVCPRCGQQVPVTEFQEHMKQELAGGAQFKPEPKKPVIAPDSDISRNLQAFAKRRTDIFGEEETDIGKTITADRAPKPSAEEQTSWEGQTVRAPATLAKPPVVLAPPVTLDTSGAYQTISQPPMLHTPEQIYMQQAMLNPQNLTPGMSPIPIPVSSPLPTSSPITPSSLGRSPYVPSPSPLEPPPKKAKLNEEEQKLIPEEDFLQSNQGPISIKVQIPQDDKIEAMKGQVLTFEMPLKATITDIKEKIKGAIGLAPNKQKIKSDTLGVLRDQNTLAYYNFTDGTLLHLDKKERGGKAKKK